MDFFMARSLLVRTGLHYGNRRQ